MSRHTRRLAPSSFAYIRRASTPTIARQRVSSCTLVASHATACLIARRCSLDTRPQWPANSIAVAVTRDAGRATRRNTSSATPVALYCLLYSFAAPTPFALSPFTVAVPRSIARLETPAKIRRATTTHAGIQIAYQNFRSWDPRRTAAEVRRLVCKVTWRELAKSCENRKEENGRADGSREFRMEEVMVDGKGGRCSSEDTSTHSRSRGMNGGRGWGGRRFYFRRRARTRFPVLTNGEYESPFCELKARLHFPLAKSVTRICGKCNIANDSCRFVSNRCTVEWHDERYF